MFLLNWYKDWLEIRREYKQSKPCDTCEALKIQVEQLRHDNSRLMERLLEKPESEPQSVVDNITPIIPKGRHIPWKIRQQMLEEKDRREAKLLRDAPKPTPIDTTTEELEQEIFNAEQERESTISKS